MLRKNFQEAVDVLTRVMENDKTMTTIAEAGLHLAKQFEAGGQVISCGNGGSMCDAMHFAEELTGRFRGNRQAIAAQAISDPGFISCAANDFGYEHVFSRYVEAHGRKGDVLVAISTSGSSANVLNAVTAAQKKAMTVIALTGKSNSPLSSVADFDICTPGGEFADRVQEVHIKVIHSLIELVERQLCPENY